MSLKRIDEIFHFEKGVLQSSKCIPGDYDFITASSDWKTHNEYTHECEALIFAAAASGSLGRTHYVNGKFVSSDLCFIITPKDQENLPVDLKFYHILFNELKDEIVRNTKAGTSKEAIGLGSFGKYKLPYFEIGKQIEIKNHFVNSEGTKEELSTELNHQLTLVKKLRQQLLQDAVQGKLVPQNLNDEPASELLKKIKTEKQKLIEQGKLAKDKAVNHINELIPYNLPKSWVWCRLSDIAEAIDPNPSHRMPNYVNNGIPFISTENFKLDDSIDFNIGKKVTEETLKEHNARYEIHDDSFAFSRIGTIGRTIKLPMQRTYCLSHALSVINPISKKLSLKYLRFVMSAEFILRQAKSDVKSISVPDLGMAKIRNFFIPLPPFNEQNRIVQKVDELMQTCDALEASIKESAAQNEKLLQQVLREALRKEEVGV